MRKIGIMAVVLLSLLVLSGFSALANGENREKSIYPMYGINPQHNFQSEFSAKDNDGHLADVKDFSLTEWVVIDGRYVYGFSGFPPDYIIVKYDIKTGKVVWDTQKSFRFASTHEPSLILWNKTLYFYLSDVGDYTYTGSGDDRKGCTQTLWAFSTINGKVLWKYNAIKVLGEYYHKSLIYAGDWGNLPVVAKDGTIYLSVAGEYNNTTYNAIIAVNSNGTTKWIFPLENSCVGSQELTLDKQGNIYRLTGGTGYTQSPVYLYSISPNGTLRWKARINLKEYSGAAIYRDRIYFVGIEANSTQWKLLAYNTDGKFLWAYKTGNLTNFLYTPEIYTPTIAPNGDIYLTNGTWIYSISPNGTLNWKLKISNVYFIVADRDSYIYFSTGKDIYRLSPDGKARILYDLSDYKEGEKVLSSSIYIGPNQTIYAFCGCPYGTYLYIFDNNPFAFLENPIFITVIVVIIAMPATYLTVRKIRNKKEVKEE